MSKYKLEESDWVSNDELKKGAERIGGNSLEAMQWILRFAQTPLESLSQGNFANLSIELFMFAEGYPKKPHRFDLEEDITTFEGSTTALRPDKKEALWLQQFTNHRFEELFMGSELTFPFDSFALELHVFRTTNRTLMFPALKELRDRFTYYLAQLLGEYAHRLANCVECRKTFLSVRLNQKFCGAKCRSRATTREFRKAQTSNSGGAKERRSSHGKKGK